MNPQEQEVKQNLKVMARSIQSQLPGPHWGFILLVFPFGEGGQLLYIANSNRQDAVQAMREFIAKNAANPEAFTDQGEGTNADHGFEKWWLAEMGRIQIEGGAAILKMETIRQLAYDAFIAGMVWSPE